MQRHEHFVQMPGASSLAPHGLDPISAFVAAWLTGTTLQLSPYIHCPGRSEMSLRPLIRNVSPGVLFVRGGMFVVGGCRAVALA